MPHFRVDVEEIKKTELEGIVGLLAKLLGKSFDDIVTQVADGRAALLNQKLNAEVAQRAAVFKQYGVFCGIDYSPDQVILHFDLTRLKSEGIVGYVFAAPQPGTGTPLSVGQSPERFPRVHDQSGRARPVGSGLRGRGLSCAGQCYPGCDITSGLARAERPSLRDRSRIVNPCQNGLQDKRRRVSRLLIPIPARFRSTGSSIPAMGCTFTRHIRTRSL